MVVYTVYVMFQIDSQIAETVMTFKISYIFQIIHHNYYLSRSSDNNLKSCYKKERFGYPAGISELSVT